MANVVILKHAIVRLHKAASKLVLWVKTKLVKIKRQNKRVLDVKVFSPFKGLLGFLVDTFM